MKQLKKLATLAALTGVAQCAMAGLVNFEDIGLSAGSTGFAGQFVSQGFLFQSSQNHIHSANQSAPFADSGSANLMFHDNGGNNPNNTLTMTRVSGGTFSIQSLWSGEGFTNFGAASIHVIGNLSGGGTVSTDFTFDGIIDGVNGDDFELFTFSSAWANLDSLTIVGVGGTPGEHSFSVDNITVDQSSSRIPEPATLGLTAAALLGLAASRRKRA